MSRVGQKNTKPEILVAQALRQSGHGYRKNVRDLPGRPDFANKHRKWAILVNGCYWHHHHCRRGTVPTRNREFWLAKFEANRKRDAKVIRKLRAMGFRVLLVWECEALDRLRLPLRLAALPALTQRPKAEEAVGRAPRPAAFHRPQRRRDAPRPRE